MTRIWLCGIALMVIGGWATLTGLPAKGANNPKDIITGFDYMFSSLDSLIFGTEATRERLLFISPVGSHEINATPTVSPALDSALNARTKATIREGNSKTGLQLTGQIYARPDAQLGLDDDYGESRYNGKLQVELRWYLLQSSIFGRKGREREARLEEEVARAGYEKERIDINDFRIKEELGRHYDSIRSGVLQYRARTLQMLDEARHFLLEREDISSDELMRTIDERMEAERTLASFGRAYPPAQGLADVEASVVTVDTEAVVSRIMQSQGDIKILELRMKLLEEQERNTHYWQKINVAPFVRYSYYTRPNLPNSSNVDLGLTFTVPLSGETARRKESLIARRNVLAAEGERLLRRAADKAALISSEIDRLNRESEGEAKRIGELKKYLEMRTSAYQRGLGEHNRLSRAREYIAYIECLERLVELQRNRDMRLADLQALLPDVSVLRFCTLSPIVIPGIENSNNSNN